jgi:hypothetical protein
MRSRSYIGPVGIEIKFAKQLPLQDSRGFRKTGSEMKYADGRPGRQTLKSKLHTNA